MEDKLRERFRLNLSIRLALFPRGLRHDLWRQTQPQNDRARALIVNAIIDTVDETVDVAEKAQKARYLGH